MKENKEDAQAAPTAATASGWSMDAQVTWSIAKWLAMAVPNQPMPAERGVLRALIDRGLCGDDGILTAHGDDLRRNGKIRIVGTRPAGMDDNFWDSVVRDLVKMGCRVRYSPIPGGKVIEGAAATRPEGEPEGVAMKKREAAEQPREAPNTDMIFRAKRLESASRACERARIAAEDALAAATSSRSALKTARKKESAAIARFLAVASGADQGELFQDGDEEYD